MPTLLLHSAICMKHGGDKENAKAFLDAIILQYPESSEAKKAKDELVNL